MKHGQKITFAGESDEAPGLLPGDVIFVLQMEEHTLFRRKGADLLIEHEISLAETLCGFSFPIKHLDGRTVTIHNTGGQVGLFCLSVVLSVPMNTYIHTYPHTFAHRYMHTYPHE